MSSLVNRFGYRVLILIIFVIFIGMEVDIIIFIKSLIIVIFISSFAFLIITQGITIIVISKPIFVILLILITVAHIVISIEICLSVSCFYSLFLFLIRFASRRLVIHSHQLTDFVVQFQ